MNIVGRMKEIFAKAKSKKPKPAPPPIGVKLGTDISNLVTSELVYLSDPDTEDLFWSKYAEGSLLVYDKKASIPEGKGPMICCVDISSSMKGQPLNYAMALFTSMAKMALESKRQVVFMPFASYSHKGIEISDVSSLLGVLSSRNWGRLGGGTRFEAPLDQARELISIATPSAYADVVFITDGVSSVNDLWIERFKHEKSKLGFKLIGINVMSSWSPEYMGIFDVVASMGSSGEMSKLEWLENKVEAMV
jgi:uncharacterized protein with von Willebrand factor type A (vWA) domain